MFVRKWSSARTGIKLSGKTASVQSQTFKYIQKSLTTIAQDQSLAPWKKNTKKWEVAKDFCTALYYGSVYFLFYYSALQWLIIYDSTCCHLTPCEYFLCLQFVVCIPEWLEIISKATAVSFLAICWKNWRRVNAVFIQSVVIDIMPKN